MTFRPAFGARQRPFDVRETRYAYAAPAKAADWSVPVGAPVEQRAAIWDQGQTSACTASLCEALETAARLQGRAAPELSHEYVYWEARRRDNWFGAPAGADTGAYLASVADVALGGIAREEVAPFDAIVTLPPPAAAYEDAAGQDYLAAHRAIYPGRGAADQVYDALRRGLTIQAGWVVRSDMYAPGGRPYPRGLTPDPYGRHGFHASYLCRAFRDDGGAVLGVMPNSWGAAWNAGIERLYPRECRPGEAVIPLLDWVERTDSPLFELRVLDLEPFTPPPPPDPEPEPAPQPGPVADERYERLLSDLRGYAAACRQHAEASGSDDERAWWDGAAVWLQWVADTRSADALRAARARRAGLPRPPARAGVIERALRVIAERLGV